MRKVVVIFSILVILVFYGCSGLKVAIENQQVQVTSKLNQVPFFDVYPGQKVFVSVKNFSEYSDLDIISSLVTERYSQRGFIIVDDPRQADWVVEAKIVNVKKEDLPARKVIKANTKEEEGAGIIYSTGFVGVVSESLRATIAAGLLGGALTRTLSLAINSGVKLGFITIVTDIQVKEKVKSEIDRKVSGKIETANIKEEIIKQDKTKWIKYRLRAVSIAKKTGLKWEDCSEQMVREITRIVDSLL